MVTFFPFSLPPQKQKKGEQKKRFAHAGVKKKEKEKGYQREGERCENSASFFKKNIGRML